MCDTRAGLGGQTCGPDTTVRALRMSWLLWTSAASPKDAPASRLLWAGPLGPPGKLLTKALPLSKRYKLSRG